MPALTDRLFSGTDSPAYPVIGALLLAMGVVDLLDNYGGDTLGAVASLLGAVSMLSFYAGAKTPATWLRWVGLAAFVAFVVLAVVDAFGLAT